MMKIFILLNKYNNRIIFIIWIVDLLIYIIYNLVNYIIKINFFYI